MTLLYTLAFPRLAAADRNRIDRVRAENDPDARLVAPHFTLVFGCRDVSAEAFEAHVAGIAAATPAFAFQARRIEPGSDDRGNGYAFLVPDDGGDGFLTLHGRLYSGLLAPFRRHDIPFVPHITLGRRDSLETAVALCDTLNKDPLDVAGSIEALAVVVHDGDRVTERACFDLAAQMG